MNKEGLDLIINNISVELGLESGEDHISESDLLDVIAERVGQLMDTDSGLLFSYLYRLDVSESSLQKLLYDKSEKTIAHKIAYLILERQKKRIETKSQYGPGPQIDGWEW